MSKAYQTALSYLSRAQRTTEEVRRYLLRKGFDDEEIDKAILKLTQIGYLNDEKYLENYLGSGKSQKYGYARLKLKLLQKGINPELLKNINIDEDEEVAKALELLQKKYKNINGVDKAKYYRFLVNRGFTPTVARKALSLTDNMDKG